MSDTVQKLMVLADRYAIAYGWGGDNGVKTHDERQALEAQLRAEIEKRDAVLRVALWNLKVFRGRDFVDEAISNIEEVLG